MKNPNQIKIAPLGYVIGKDRYIHSDEWYETFEEAQAKANGSSVFALELTPTVWRLNTLPGVASPSQRKVLDEIRWRLRVFGKCNLGWTCMGHSRARWQTSSAALSIPDFIPGVRVVVNETGTGLTVFPA